jgi:hypothetical protein
MYSDFEVPTDWFDEDDGSSPLIEKSKEELEISNAENDIQECDFYINPVLLTDVDIEPEFMKDAAGRHLFAPSSVVTIFGESGARKSFLLQTAVHDHCGVMVQLESTARGVRKRLVKMKYPDTATGRYVFPETRAQVLAYVNIWKDISPTIIGFDSFAPLMGLWGGDTNQDQDVQKLFNEVFHPLRNAGHCVVFLDHVPKNTKNNGFAIGSQNKKAQVDLALRVDLDSHGTHSVYVTKDRDNVYEGRGIDYSGFYGYLELSEDPLRAVVRQFEIEDISFDYQQALGIIPKQINRKDRVIEVLKADGPMGKDSLRKAVGGNTDSFGKTLGALARDGKIFIGKGLTKQGTRAKVLVSLDPIPNTD